MVNPKFDVFRIARDARLYRLAARDLRHCAALSREPDARETLFAKARRMDKRASDYEALIQRYAKALIVCAECAECMA